MMDTSFSGGGNTKKGYTTSVQHSMFIWARTVSPIGIHGGTDSRAVAYGLLLHNHRHDDCESNASGLGIYSRSNNWRLVVLPAPQSRHLCTSHMGSERSDAHAVFHPEASCLCNTRPLIYPTFGPYAAAHLINLQDAVCYRLGAAVQPHPYHAYSPVGLDTRPAVHPREPDKGTRRRQGEQTIAAASTRQNFFTQCDDFLVAHCPALSGVLFALYHPIGVCQRPDAVVYRLVQRA